MDCSPVPLIAVSVAINPVLRRAIEAVNVVRKMRGLQAGLIINAVRYT
jgi:hypothetical protein